MKVSRKSQVERHLKKVFDQNFDDPKIVKAILGPFPEQEEFDKRQKKVEEARKNAGYPAALRPCYEKPILTPSQETYLFRKYNYFKYKAKQILFKNYRIGGNNVKKAEEYWHQAIVVRNFIADCNMRLAANIIRYSDEKEDLMSEAYAIVLHAIDLFDWRRGFKFSTYATYAIRNASHKYWETEREYRRLHGGYITNRTHAVDERDYGAEKRQQHYERVSDLLLKEAGLDVKNSREEKVARANFGIGRKEETLEKIGRRMKGLSKERIRQLKARAIAHMQIRAGVLQVSMDE